MKKLGIYRVRCRRWSRYTDGWGSVREGRSDVLLYITAYSAAAAERAALADGKDVVKKQTKRLGDA